MNCILSLDDTGYTVVVEPGVVNTVLDATVQAQGLYYPPDPSSGRSATIGGNIGANSGGAHCFKYGVTASYVAGLHIVLADGELLRIGGPAFDYPEYDLVGLLVGSEGTLAIVTEATLRLLRHPPAFRTLMAAFDSVETAGEAVSAVIGAGLIPAAMEMMDARIIAIVEQYAPAGLPIDAGAVLIVEVDGYTESVTAQIEEIATILQQRGAFELKIAQNQAERAAIWFGRKSAVGAMARLAPAYYLVDGTVPRSKLAQALADINTICDAEHLDVGYVFHAGDGNLHPLVLISDPTDTALMTRVHRAGQAIMALCVSMGGSITGEHGVGLEKRNYMGLMYNRDELNAMQTIKRVFDPQGRLNPAKIFPPDTAPVHEPATAAPTDCPQSPYAPENSEAAAAAIRAWSSAGLRIRVRGGGSQSALLPPSDVILSSTGLNYLLDDTPAELAVTVGAGMPLETLQQHLAQHRLWWPVASPWATSTVGGIVATASNAPLRMRYGGVRDLVLAVRVVLPDGTIIRMGRPVVKNVAGYDLVRLFTGAHGTLGLITEVTLKLAPIPRARATLILPVEHVQHGVQIGMRLRQQALIASAVLLVRGSPIPTGKPTPYQLLYTCEGPATQDVHTAIAQACAIAREEGATGVVFDNPSGSLLWSQMIGSWHPDVLVLRMGLPPGVFASVFPRLVDRYSRVAPADAPFIADLVSGQLSIAHAHHLNVWRHVAQTHGGYVIVLQAPPDQRDSVDRWGPQRQSNDLMRQIKAAWDAHGRFNPDAFVV
ncbi:MAG: FAD-binding protein, partial [Chloroflexaceae bacterium]|nr:FAD-binding protein [Chloroflexaceae bacterium]